MKKNDAILFKTPISTAVIRGTIFSIEVKKNRNTRFQVFEGKIKVSNDIANKDTVIDEAIVEKLDKYFDENSVIVNEHQTCNVEENDSVLKNISESNFNKRIQNTKIPILLVGKANTKEISMEVKNFLSDAHGKDKSFHIVSCKFHLSPTFASLTIDGIQKEYKNKEIFLSDGSHNIRIEAPGFNSHEVIKEVHGKHCSFTFNLEKDKEAKAINWKFRVKSKYLLFEPSLNYLISINKTGTVEAYTKNKKQWALHLMSNVVGQPIINNRKLILATNENKIMSINLKNGSINWNRSVNLQLNKGTQLIASGEGVYAIIKTGHICRFSHKGVQIWKQSIGGPINTSPVLTKDMLLLPSGKGIVIGLDKERGYKVFRVILPSSVVAMAVMNNNLCLATAKGSIYYYDYNDDEMIWNYKSNNDLINNFFIDDRAIYAFSYKGTIYKLNSRGTLMWKYNIGPQKTMRYFKDTTHLYVAGDRTLFVVDKKRGNLKWSVILSPRLSKNIAFTKDKLFFTTKEKGLVILNK